MQEAVLSQQRVNLETTSLQMSCAAALVAVMGKLHGEEGHTQLESGKSVGSRWWEVGRETQEERRNGREGRGGRAHRTRSDLVECRLFVHWVSTVCCLLAGAW